mgnify:CR=1 FL=1
MNELLNSVAYEKVLALTRTKIVNKKAKLHNIVTNFENLESIQEQLKADDVFCADFSAVLPTVPKVPVTFAAP